MQPRRWTGLREVSPAATPGWPRLRLSAAGQRATGRGLRRRARWTVALLSLLIALGLLLFVSLRAADGDDGGARGRAFRASLAGPGARAAPVGQVVSVSIDARAVGRPVPANFLGLSFEVSSAAQIARYGQMGNLVGLLRSLGTGLLRLGGASADSRTAWVDARTPRPAWASNVIEAGDLVRLRALAARSGWHVLLTLTLGHFDPAVGAREAAAAKSALGPWLAGIEIGNEPDSYARHQLRGPGWGTRQYNGEVGAYRRAISRVAPGLAIAGPDVSGSLAFERWGAAEARVQRPWLMTGHHYPLRCDSVPPPSIAALLSPTTRRLEGLSLGRFLSISRRAAIPFRMDETGTVSCGGRPGISNVFASALWGVDYITQAMAAGAAGINLEGNPANCEGYSPLCAPSAQALAGGALRAQPVWYSLLLTRALEQERPLRTIIASAAPVDLAVRAFTSPTRGLSLVVVDDEPPGTGAASISVRVGSAYARASVLALSAPTPAASSGTRLGGGAVAPDGSWQPAGALPEVGVHAGVLSLSIPAGSAELLTLSPRSARARPLG